MEIEHILGKDYLEQAMDTCIHEVMSVFYRPIPVVGEDNRYDP